MTSVVYTNRSGHASHGLPIQHAERVNQMLGEFFERGGSSSGASAINEPGERK